MLPVLFKGGIIERQSVQIKEWKVETRVALTQLKLSKRRGEISGILSRQTSYRLKSSMTVENS